VAGVVAVLLIGALVVSRMTAHTVPAPPAGATTTPDAATATYIAMVNSDMNTLDFQFGKRYDCKTRAVCIDELQQINTVAGKLLRDLSAAAPPPGLAGAGGRLKNAAQQFVDQVGATLLVLQRPDSEYITASAVPEIHDLDLAAGGVICWPATPVPVWGESTTGYTCH